MTDGNDQQNVDEAADGVATDHAEEPHDDQYDCNSV